MIKKTFHKIFFVITSLLIISLTGCSMNTSSDEYNNNIKNKINEEFNYLDDMIFEIILKLEKDEYLLEKEMRNEEEINNLEDNLNWNNIQEDILKFDQSFNSIFLDISFEQFNISKEELYSIRERLNDVLYALKIKNKPILINSLSNYYTEIVNIYSNHFQENNDSILKRQIKANLLKSYVLFLNNATNEEMLDAFNKGFEKYNEATNDYKFVEKNKYNLNKIYIILQEYKKEIEKVEDKNGIILKMKIIELFEEI